MTDKNIINKQKQILTDEKNEPPPPPKKWRMKIIKVSEQRKK